MSRVSQSPDCLFNGQNGLEPRVPSSFKRMLWLPLHVSQLGNLADTWFSPHFDDRQHFTPGQRISHHCWNTLHTYLYRHKLKKGFMFPLIWHTYHVIEPTKHLLSFLSLFLMRENTFLSYFRCPLILYRISKWVLSQKDFTCRSIFWQVCQKYQKDYKALSHIGHCETMPH